MFGFKYSVIYDLHSADIENNTCACFNNHLGVNKEYGTGTDPGFMKGRGPIKGMRSKCSAAVLDSLILHLDYVQKLYLFLLKKYTNNNYSNEYKLKEHKSRV